MVALTRRTFLRAAGAAASGALLATCAPGVRSRPNPAVGPIDPASPVERSATLRIYQWKNYLSDDVIRSFTSRHAPDDVDVDVRSFTTIAEAIERLRGPDGDFDIFFPTIDALAGLVGAGVLRPLTHELLPNLANLWPFFLEGDGPF